MRLTRERKNKIVYIQNKCNKPKMELEQVRDELYSIGDNDRADQLGRIIVKIDHWQNRWETRQKYNIKK